MRYGHSAQAQMLAKMSQGFRSLVEVVKQIFVVNPAPHPEGGKRKVASMTGNIPSGVVEIKLNVVELKLDRLIDEMRFLRSHTIAFDTRLREIEAYLKPSEPREQQPESKLTPWLTAAGSATGMGQWSGRP